MPNYVVESTKTEKRSEHRTWSAAMSAAAKMDPVDCVRVIERDRDGEREYDARGRKLREDGHYR